MSQTESMAQPPAPGQRTITLHNGQVVTFSSDEPTTMETIPIIDAARIWSDRLEDRESVAEEIREASRQIGFFYLINHGIDEKYAEETFAQARRFFALPEEKKMEVYTGLVPNEYVGYHPMECYNRNGYEHRDLSEAFNWAYDASEDPEADHAADDAGPEPSASIWPADLPGFRAGLYAHHAQLLRLARRLARAFALALRLPESHFDAHARRPGAGMRIIRYPPQARGPGEQNGIGAHTDVECFTIVTTEGEAGGGGLEVLGRGGGWVRAEPPVPGALVVNIADCLMRQTNDFFVSTVHRVVNKSGRERYSAPFFFGFDKDMRLEPVPTCVSEENPMKYPVMTGGEYYAFRANKVKETTASNGGQAVSV